MNGVNPLLDLSRRLVIGHRGAAADAPENTLPSLALAVEQGAHALELDVHVTADGVPVVIHDPTLDRTTDRTGPVAALTASQLDEVDAGARFSPDGESFPYRGRGVRVPRLAEVLEEFRHTPLLVEVKEPRAQRAVRRVLLEHEAAGRCVVASDDPAALTAFETPPFLRGAARPGIKRMFYGSLFGFPPRSVDYLLLAIPDTWKGMTVASRSFIANARRIGCPVHVWTVNDEALARRLWRRGACGIITDRPGAMMAVRAS